MHPCHLKVPAEPPAAGAGWLEGGSLCRGKGRGLALPTLLALTKGS
jgi:hypothetical protein